ncbi:MAG: SRPBCC family protein [Deltaproteobacteria bacterium]|nr:SRPBCC family protein [Deltaproteobacteria bacterium]
MIRKILIAIVLVVAGFLLYVALMPSHFHIERSILIHAPAEAVFAQVNDFHKWNDWSPWAKLDPNAKVTFEGKESGVGAVHTWAGNADVGEGKMTIVESQPNSLIRIKLEFFKPYTAENQAEFTFKPQEGGVLTTWSMDGESKFLPRVFCFFMNMDKMVGNEFEKGLAQIKLIAETPPKKKG